MNKKLLNTLLLCFLFMNFSYITDASEVNLNTAENSSFNLREIYKLTKEKIGAIPAGESQVRESQARKTQVLSRFLPALSLDGSYSHEVRKTNSTAQDQSIVKIGLRQSIFEGGRDYANLKAADTEVSARKENVTFIENNLFIAVARSFFSVLAAEQDIKNIQKSIDLTKVRLKELKRRLKVGKTQRSEMLAAEAQNAVLISQLLQAQGVLNVARDNFKQVTGLDRMMSLNDINRTPKQPKEIDFYLAEIPNRPDIKALEFGLESTRHNVSAAQAGHLPTLELTGNKYLMQSRSNLFGQNLNNFNNNKLNWDVGLTLTIPLYVGGSVNARVYETKEVEFQTSVLLENLKRVAEEEIRASHSTLVSTLDQLKALEVARKSTEENYKEQVKNYNHGLANNLDVIQSLNALQDTKRTLDKTRFEALIAWASLRAAINQVLK